jgi:hypothetical protein
LELLGEEWLLLDDLELLADDLLLPDELTLEEL